MPLLIRLSLIKELYELKEFRHLGVKEIVRRLVGAFVILRIRAIVIEVLGDYLPYY